MELTAKQIEVIVDKVAMAKGNYELATRIPDKKLCAVCGKMRSFKDYHANTQNANGLQGACRPCYRHRVNTTTNAQAKLNRRAAHWSN